MAGHRFFILRRLFFGFLTIWFALTAAFFLSRTLPGDPVRILLTPEASVETLEAVRKFWGLDESWLVQYGVFLKRLCALDLGQSFRTSRPVIEELLPAARISLILVGISVAVGALVGVPVGVIWAMTPRPWVRRLTPWLVSVGLSLPVYWVASLLLWGGASYWAFLPFLLPGITLSIFSMSGIARSTYQACSEISELSWVTSLKARGLGKAQVVWVHLLGNAWVEIIVSASGYAGYLLGGAIITETLFGLPGLGRLMTESLFSRDYPMLLGVILFYAFCIVALNVLSDILVQLVDPRVQLNR